MQTRVDPVPRPKGYVWHAFVESVSSFLFPCPTMPVPMLILSINAIQCGTSAPMSFLCAPTDPSVPGCVVVLCRPRELLALKENRKEKKKRKKKKEEKREMLPSAHILLRSCC